MVTFLDPGFHETKQEEFDGEYDSGGIVKK